MFYFLISPALTYNFILILAAIIPAIFLIVKVYKSDKMEPESPQLIWKLVKAGVLSSLLALVEERVLSLVLDSALESNTLAYNIILYFVIVAGAEESSKYLFLKRNTWRNSEFNCQYDGVVYATVVSLGFALWENISYVLSYGFATALVRAVTAIPGHACFGVFMGIFYGIAKKYERMGKKSSSKFFRVLSFIVPALLHGTYDFIATMQEQLGGWYFLVFVVLLFVVSFIMISKNSKKDVYIG